MTDKHFKTKQCDSIFVIGWDSPGSVNVLDADVVGELLDILHTADDMPHILGSVLVSLKKDTGLGANISAIYGAQKEDKVRDEVAKLHEMFFDIKALAAKKPCVMIIDGKCLGGAYELALLFPWLIATDNPETSIAVPEGLLGLIQGLGFLKRAVARIGLLNTILFATTGKSTYARPAEKMGLVDEVVANIRSNEVHLENSVRIAKERILEIAGGKKYKSNVGFFERVWRGIQKLPGVRHAIFRKAREDVMKVTHGHYPAPLAMIDVIQKGWRMSDEDACLKIEVPAFARLAVSPLAKRLMEIFFAKEQAKKMRFPGGVKFDPATDKMAVVGAGFMGRQVAFLLLKKGFWVALTDVNDAALAEALTELSGKIARDKSLRPHQKDEMRFRLRPTNSYESLSDVRCFIDMTAEKLSVKKSVLRACQKTAPDSFVFFNTSTIPISVITEGAARPERVGLLHFFSPADKMEPVEIGGDAKTSHETLATAFELSRVIGKISFVVGDSWGFAVNRVLMAGMQAGLTLLLEGCRVRDIDEAVKEYGFPKGLFELAEFVGIKTTSDVGAFMRYVPGFETFPDVLEKMAAAELTFWVKDGGKVVENPKLYGFLAAEYGWRESPEKFSSAEIVDRILLPIKDKAIRCVNESVVRDAKTMNLLLLLATGIPPAFRAGLVDES